MRRTKLSPRKAPNQERSRATVDALLQATADILVREGYAKLTTNRIAERAGVNIASLYQFFPSKDAILAEVSRRHVAEQRVATRAAFETHRGSSLEALVRTMVSVSVAAHSVAPKLHHVLTEELPARRSDTWQEEDTALAAELRQRLADIDVRDPDLALWLLGTVGHAVIHRAAIERPDDLRSGALTEELVTLIVRYLKRR
jgi:AcrR family transcriptional regulator